jgi:hypothetical protein
MMPEKQKDLYKGTTEVVEEEDYTEDYNRLDKKLNSKNITSKAEWEQRLRQFGYDTISQKFKDMWYEERIKKYIEENTPKTIIPKKVKYFRKGKPVEREVSKRWTQEQVDYINSHPDMKPEELYKQALFAGRSKISISVKRYRVFRKKFEDVPKGYGKRGLGRYRGYNDANSN